MLESQLSSSDAKTAELQPQQVRSHRVGSAQVPVQHLRAKESPPQTERLKLHDLKDKHFQSTAQTGPSKTQAGKFREFNLTTSDKEAHRQEVKESLQELTRSTTETHGVTAKE